MTVTLEWTCKSGRWFARSAAGVIRVHQRDLGNRGLAWQITFPNGKGFRANTIDEAKSYAEDQHERVASEMPR